MNTRTAVIAAFTAIGIVCGPLALDTLPVVGSSLGWPTHLASFFGFAFGVPLLLASLATSGRYKAMVRLWSILGLLAVLLVATGASATVLALASSHRERVALLVLVMGVGLVVGLSIVKLAIRRGRAVDGA